MAKSCRYTKVVIAQQKSGKRRQKVVITWQKVAITQKWSLHGKKVVKKW